MIGAVIVGVAAVFRDEQEPPFTEEVIHQWMVEYLGRRRELRGGNPDHVTDDEIKTLK